MAVRNGSFSWRRCPITITLKYFAPRGAATTPDGERLFVLNANDDVHVFDTKTQAQLGVCLQVFLSRAEKLTAFLQGGG